jgi:hypothetical protein
MRRATAAASVAERARGRLVAHDHDVGERGQLGAQLVHERPVVGVPMATGDEEEPRPGLAQDEAELAAAVDREDRVRDRAEPRGGEHHDDRLRPVGKLEGDDVPGTDPPRDEPAREPLGGEGERREAGARRAVDDRRPLARAPRRGRERLPDRLAQPETIAPVALGERRTAARNRRAQAVLALVVSCRIASASAPWRPIWVSAVAPVKRAADARAERASLLTAKAPA